jgi:hypothetical protein
MKRPRLTYFDFAGSRGEQYRIALHLAMRESSHPAVPPKRCRRPSQAGAASRSTAG